jgi:hypothetical protein
MKVEKFVAAESISHPKEKTANFVGCAKGHFLLCLRRIRRVSGNGNTAKVGHTHAS